MVVDVKVKANTIKVDKYLKSLEKKFPKAIQQSLNRVSAFGVKQITEKTQKGKGPDGARFRGYAESTKKSRLKKGRQVSFVDLTDTGQMFRSLTWKARRNKSTLFFRRHAENKKASFHDYFGAGKSKVVRPFFSIGRKDEIQIHKRFAQHLFRLTGIR